MLRDHGLPAEPEGEVDIRIPCDDGASDGASDVESIARSAGAIRSGNLTISFVMADEVTATDVGFTISGPFSLGSEGSPPVADLTLEQVSGSKTTTSRFVLDGDAAYAVVDGRTYELPPDRHAAFAAFAQQPEDGLLASLDLARWIERPRVARQGSVAGEPTDVIVGDLRGVEALAGITSLLANAGAADAVPQLPVDADRERLENAIRSGTIEIEVGRNDGILRRVEVEVALAPVEPDLATLAQVRLRFEVRIERPNDPVDVEAPSSAEPFPP
jgi:hypothetical protein